MGRKIVAAIRKCYIGLGVRCTGTLCVSVAGAERLKGLRAPFCTEGTITGDGKRGAAESSRKASDKVNHQRPLPLRRPARRRKERLYNQQRSYGNGKDRERAGTSKQATDRCSADRSINLQGGAAPEAVGACRPSGGEGAWLEWRWRRAGPEVEAERCVKAEGRAAPAAARERGSRGGRGCAVPAAKVERCVKAEGRAPSEG